MTLHVLVVDDSAVVRQTVSAILSAQGMSVVAASDPVIAMQKMKDRRPDVILLDIEMPRMDGLTFLRHIMRDDPMPVVICSAVAGPSTETAVRALESGALDIVAKPRIGVRDFLQESSVVLGDAVRGAAQARMAVPTRMRRPDVPPAASVSSPGAAGVIALGASTGGTEALRCVLSEFTAETAGCVVVQHMPEIFTAHFARRLDTECAVHVREATDGDAVLPGTVTIAPGNQHMTLQRDGAGFVVRLGGGPLVSRHRPSIDVLFHSVAATAGANACGALLTGMGADGAEGLLAMRRAGAFTVAQDEATSVVFGMPKEAIARGAAGKVLPLDRIAEALSGSRMTRVAFRR
jgi:two-component system chemotaxis response regulator CheB